MGIGGSSFGEELYKAVNDELETEDKHLGAKITGMLLEADDKSIEAMLNSRCLLLSVMKRTKDILNHLTEAELNEGHVGSNLDLNSLATSAAISDDTDYIGDLLYKKIVIVYPDQASKLTGMLLEMDRDSLQGIVECNSLFQEALERAHSVLIKGIKPESETHLQYQTDCDENRVEYFGDVLFDKIELLYPADASKITGMLLELDGDTLKSFLRDDNAFHEAVSKAAKVINS